MPERLQKIISAHGVASRRYAEKLISEGRVYVNGVRAVIGQSADFEIDEIVVDGNPLRPIGELVYIMLNKPCGYLTTACDDRGRKTVMELVEDAGVRVYPVGRLDLDSEGLLLLTNDGAFANVAAHPRFNKLKTYEITVRGDAQLAVLKLSRPMLIDSHQVRAKSVGLIRKTHDGGVLSVTIGEGRNRQIRKMCAGSGLEVLSLIRVSLGRLELGSLESGKWRHLTSAERMTILADA